MGNDSHASRSRSKRPSWLPAPSKRKLQRELQLPRVKHRSRLAETGKRSTGNRYRHEPVSDPSPRVSYRLLRGARHRGSALLDGKRGCVVVVLGDGGSGPAESRGAVNVTHFIHVRVVEQVESVDTQIEQLGLGKPKIPRQAQIPRIQWRADVGVSADGRRAVGDGSARTGDRCTTDTIRA